MSIGMEQFGSHGRFLTYDPYQAAPQRVKVFQLQCRQCGFEPDDPVTTPKLCPKCHSQSWERFTRPGSILNNAERY